MPIVNKLLAHDKKVVYTWTEKDGSDCQIKKEDDTNAQSFFWEWEWLKYKDTKKKGVVDCPKVPDSAEGVSHLQHHEKCIEYDGLVSDSSETNCCCFFFFFLFFF